MYKLSTPSKLDSLQNMQSQLINGFLIQNEHTVLSWDIVCNLSSTKGEPG